MPKFIYKLPNLIIILLCIAMINLLAHWAPHIVKAVYFLKPTEETIKIAQSLFALLGATVGVFIGFLLNQAQSNFQAASALAASEASQINNLDRFFSDLTIATLLRLELSLRSILNQLSIQSGRS